MLLRIFQGSKPIAASTTPTRIDSKTSRKATASGVPPRKRYRPSLAAGNSLVSFGIAGLPARICPLILVQSRADGEPARWRQWLRTALVAVSLMHILNANRHRLRLQALRLSA